MNTHVKRILVIINVDELTLVKRHVPAQVLFHQLRMLQLKGFLLLTEFLSLKLFQIIAHHIVDNTSQIVIQILLRSMTKMLKPSY